YSPDHLRAMNHVAALVRSAAEQFGRIFYIEYDLSGARESTWVEDVKRDWANVILGQLQATSSPRYVRQQGKPVVMLWGLGFPERPYTASRAVELVRWLKEQGCFVGGGVPYRWREDSKVDYLMTVYPLLDLIQPWAVGAFADPSDVALHFNTI